MESSSRQTHHRIALISGGIPLGGSTTFLINFAGELVRRGIPVEVINFEKKNPMSSDFEKQNIPLLCLDDGRLIFEDRMNIVLQKLARFQPTVVVASLGPASFEVLRYLPRGVFRIGMAHTDELGIYRMIGRYISWIDLAAMVSQTMTQKVASLPEFARVPVVCLPYGVPMCPSAELPVKDVTRPLRILYLGRLSQEQKRVRLFPEILRQMCENGMPFHWTIAGAGEQLGFLEAGLKTHSPDQTVSFAGPVRYADVPTVLKQHDVYLLASDYEGLPLSLLEAMGHGLVPVVSDLKSGIREVVDETEGLLVPVDDVPGYARAIIRLHGHREELAVKSAAARARVQQEFSVAAMTDRWLAALPSTKRAIEQWSTNWRIRGVVGTGNPFHFSPPVRMLRRLAARMRN